MLSGLEAERTTDRVARLHRAASDWHAQYGTLVDAIGTWLARVAFERVAHVPADATPHPA